MELVGIKEEKTSSLPRDSSASRESVSRDFDDRSSFFVARARSSLNSITAKRISAWAKIDRREKSEQRGERVASYLE